MHRGRVSDEIPRIPHETREPVPQLIGSAEQLHEYCTRLETAAGPIAIDAERASGYTYSQRAYLIQMRRDGAGTALIDPIACTDLSELATVTHGVEWILHAATQDLECLAEVGLTPMSLFDTELAGRLLGRERVGLAPLMESELGVFLEKGHGAADWSQRPLTEPMLRYAALDVELLIELRDSLESALRENNKWEIAQQEFAALARWKPKARSGDPWRRLSGIHTVKNPRTQAIARELWLERDEIARSRDIAPGRILPDKAIIAAAQGSMAGITDLFAVKGFHGRGAKKFERLWLSAIERALALPADELPRAEPRENSVPPVRTWNEKNPIAWKRLESVRSHLARISESIQIPVENLMQPELIRVLCWECVNSEAEVEQFMRDRGAREWQIDLCAPLIWQSCSGSLTPIDPPSMVDSSPSSDH